MRGEIARMVGLTVGLVACVPSDEPPARWAYIHAAIVAPACATAGCHSTLTATAGINLSTADGAFTMLTGRICGEPVPPQAPPRNYVTPYASEASTLIYQLRGDTRDVMPPDAPLPDAEIALVARWIDEGATCE